MADFDKPAYETESIVLFGPGYEADNLEPPVWVQQPAFVVASAGGGGDVFVVETNGYGYSHSG